MEGTVKWFHPTKGFGFIQPTTVARDVFVHITAVQSAGLGTLTEGQRLIFQVEMRNGRPAATQLSRA
jgi:CspA family cold shock protein